MLSIEYGRLESRASECACCPVPCCDYCTVRIIWSVVAHSKDTNGSIVDEVDFSWLLDITFEVNNDSGAAHLPPSFRNIEAVGLEECQLVPNTPDVGWDEPTLGSFLYTRKNGGILSDSFSSDITATLNTFDIKLNCNNQSLPGAIEDPPEDYSTVNLQIQGDPSLSADMPSCWASYLSLNVPRVYEIVAGYGETILVETDLCTGWDESSLTETISIEITPC
jgi:hypothetical protein